MSSVFEIDPSPSESDSSNQNQPKKRNQGFTDQQKRCIAEALVSLDIQHTFGFGGQPAAEPEPETWHGVLLEDLCDVELLKHQHPSTKIWAMIIDYSQAGQLAEDETLTLLRYYGVLGLSHDEQSYQCHLPVPAGMLRGDQFQLLAKLLQDNDASAVQLTQRGSFTIDGVKPENLHRFFLSLYDLGLSYQGLGIDPVRNIVLSPTAGFDSTELIDLHREALELNKLLQNTAAYHMLPWKFDIAIDNGGTAACNAERNDVAFAAVSVNENDQGVDPGVYCRLMLGGTQDDRIAEDTGYICEPRHILDVSTAIMDLFLAHGNRTDRSACSFRHLIDAQSISWVCEQLCAILENNDKTDARLIAIRSEYQKERPAIDESAQVGVHPQSQKDLRYVGIPTDGVLDRDQLEGLGDIAQRYGNNDIRLTPEKTVLIPHIEDASIDKVMAAIKALGFSI